MYLRNIIIIVRIIHKLLLLPQSTKESKINLPAPEKSRVSTYNIKETQIIHQLKNVVNYPVDKKSPILLKEQRSHTHTRSQRSPNVSSCSKTIT